MNKITDQKAPQFSNKVILIAEDDDTSFALFKAYLSRSNYTILYARNGVETLDLMKKHPETDLILMDLKMPVMDGFEATRKIREFNKSIPIIAQTAYALSGDKQRALDVGCDDYISKPINKEELLEKIHFQLQR
jgi:two-component system, cell cycle response regulator DivK